MLAWVFQVLVVFIALVFGCCNPVFADPAFQMKRVSNVTEILVEFDPRGWSVEGNKKLFAEQKSLGFDSVRIGLKPSSLPNFRDPKDEEILKRVRETVQAALSLDLNVILELHSEPGDIYPLLNAKDPNPHFDEYVHRVWRLAKFVAEFPAQRVAIEPINQPMDGSPELWKKRLVDLWQKCRDAAPKHTIILDAPNWSSIEGLEQLPAISDGNTYAAIYFHEPFAFTHQGAEWAPAPIPLLQELPFPVTPVGIEHALSKTIGTIVNEKRDLWRSDPARLKSMTNSVIDAVVEYDSKKYDQQFIKRRFDKAKAWSKARGMPLFLAGFGVRRKDAPRPDAISWYQLVRQEAESAGMAFGPWFLWNYQRPGAHFPDDDFLGAIGLAQSKCAQFDPGRAASNGENKSGPELLSYTQIKGGDGSSQLKFEWKCPAGTSGFVSYFHCAKEDHVSQKLAAPSGGFTLSGKAGNDYWFSMTCSDAARIEDAGLGENERFGFAVRM